MTDTKDYLRGLMARYTTEYVRDPEGFEREIRSYLELDDWKMEGYKSPDYQRSKSVKFEWGHNHDFGTFKLDGVLEDRHINILTAFIDYFGLPRDLRDKQVLDVGVWCGGTTLLLAAMGASVVAVEEVFKYSQCVQYLALMFGLHIPVSHSSLYLCLIDKEKYDYIIFPGVLYHLSDPIVALRLLFNSLKDGGSLFIETSALPSYPPSYEGAMRYGGSESGFSSWFIPSRSALLQMLFDVGFTKGDVAISDVTEDRRMFAVAKRTRWRDMLRAGLSWPNVR